MKKVLVIGGGAAGMMQRCLPREADGKFMYLKKMKSWERNYLLQERQM